MITCPLVAILRILFDISIHASYWEWWTIIIVHVLFIACNCHSWVLRKMSYTMKWLWERMKSWQWLIVYSPLEFLDCSPYIIFYDYDIMRKSKIKERVMKKFRVKKSRENKRTKMLEMNFIICLWIVHMPLIYVGW